MIENRDEEDDTHAHFPLRLLGPTTSSTITKHGSDPPWQQRLGDNWGKESYHDDEDEGFGRKYI